MKKYIVSAMMALAAMFGAAAQNSNDYALQVNTKDGNVVEYAFEYCPVATFDGDELVITDDRSDESLRCNMGDILNITIKKPSVGVQAIDAASHLKIAVTKDALTISGLQQNAEVVVFDMSGAKVASVSSDDEGLAVVVLERLSKGIYVASMPGNSFKFVR